MKQRLLRTALMLVLIFCSSAAWAEKQMYSKLTGSTLTVYYDENKTETDYSWPVAFATRGNFTNVIFDNSFAEARPTSTTAPSSAISSVPATRAHNPPRRTPATSPVTGAASSARMYSLSTPSKVATLPTRTSTPTMRIRQASPAASSHSSSTASRAAWIASIR